MSNAVSSPPGIVSGTDRVARAMLSMRARCAASSSSLSAAAARNSTSPWARRSGSGMNSSLHPRALMRTTIALAADSAAASFPRSEIASEVTGFCHASRSRGCALPEGGPEFSSNQALRTATIASWSRTGRCSALMVVGV